MRFHRALARAIADPDRTLRSDAALAELAHLWGNGSWTASPEYLAASMSLASEGSGPILECGSGLSTILVAAATHRTGRELVSLDHWPEWGAKVNRELQRAGLTHARVQVAPLKTTDRYDWYDVSRDSLPPQVSLVLCDGPPGDTRGGRSGLLPECWRLLAPDFVILLDDASREGERAVIADWIAAYPLSVTMLGSSGDSFAELRRSGSDEGGNPRS